MVGSVEERMLQGVLIPDAFFVKDEDLPRVGILEDHLVIVFIIDP